MEGVIIVITVGIDVGSITAKAAVMQDENVISHALILTGYNARNAGEKVLESVIRDVGIEFSSIDKIISTGYGRKSVAAAHKTVTEITCHAMGAHYLNPAIRSVIDIGGQDWVSLFFISVSFKHLSHFHCQSCWPHS